MTNKIERNRPAYETWVVNLPTKEDWGGNCQGVEILEVKAAFNITPIGLNVISVSGFGERLMFMYSEDRKLIESIYKDIKSLKDITRENLRHMGLEEGT